ncbi:MAG TPA: allantoicase, partial [Hyalangium sp.]|nr:allantoicase [Hyalangium sp.]
MQTPEDGKVRVAFAELIDLVSEKVGGKALIANDEFFAPKENLLKPGRGVFIPDKYTEFGKWMDGWETRRKRVPGYDWCILQLGLPGVIRGVNVDTNHFLGNFPEYASVDGLEVEGSPTTEALTSASWTEIVPRTKLHGGTQNLLPVASERRWTHVRLNIYPDGGVARFRVHGVVKPDPAKLRSGELVDLAAAENGGIVVTTNDAFFSPKDNLILPGRATTMGEGWETRRKRVPGFDWIVVKLAVPGTVHKVEVDTNHFKGNYPDMCSLEGCFLKE